LTSALYSTDRKLQQRWQLNYPEAPPLVATAVDKRRTFTNKYYHDPAAFSRDCFTEQLADYQDNALTTLDAQRRVAVRGPHGLGKTALAARAVLWFALTREAHRDDWKIPTTASAWRQLTHFLWPEIAKWTRRLNWQAVGWRGPFDERRELLTLSIKLEHGEAFALASDKSDLIEGAHASQLLYVFDESKSVPDDTWDSAEGAFSTGDCYWLAISTPGEPQGRFFDIHNRRPGYEDWQTRHVTLAEAIAAGRISADWAAQREAQWGAGSAVYQNRVLGEFATSQTTGIIPLAWVERANDNWQAWQDAGKPYRIFSGVGVDVGGGTGGDKIVFALCYDGVKIDEIRSAAFALDPAVTTMEIVGQVGGILDKQRAGVAVVDVIGLGAGVQHRLIELNKPSIPFNAASGTHFTDKSGELGFENWRAAGWWMLRELLDPSSGVEVCLPPDDTLTGDLTAPRIERITSSSKMIVESKEKIRKRLGRSTDSADAIIQIIIGPHLWRESNTPTEQTRIVYRPR
jgi:hypothetical protein